jgi:hypothetical protein
MRISSGDVILAEGEGQRLGLEKWKVILARVKRRFAHIPAGVSLTEQLIAERRVEAGRQG